MSRPDLTGAAVNDQRAPSSASRSRPTSRPAATPRWPPRPRSTASTWSACSPTCSTSRRCPRCSRWPRATSRVRLGPACLNPYTLHPYEIAGQAAALDAASGGRGYLGLARGAWLDAVGLAQPRPLTRLREAAAVVRALLSGDEAGFAGQVFRLAPGTRLRYPLPARVPPLLLGAWGPRGTALAGRGRRRAQGRRHRQPRRDRARPAQPGRRGQPRRPAGPPAASGWWRARSPWWPRTARPPAAWPGPRSPCTWRWSARLDTTGELPGGLARRGSRRWSRAGRRRGRRAR